MYQETFRVPQHGNYPKKPIEKRTLSMNKIDERLSNLSEKLAKMGEANTEA